MVIVDAPVVRKRSNQRVIDRAFYVGMAVAAVVTVFVGFVPTYFLRSHFVAQPLPLYLHLHGLVFTVWIVVSVVQTTLIAARRVDLHRPAGHEADALSFLTTPFFDIGVFLVLTAAAVRYPREPETHKRLMLLATINILDAPISRWPLAIMSTLPVMYVLVTDLFVVIAIVYDLVTRRRVHPTYLWGGLLMLVGQFSRDLVGQTAAWHSVARLLIG